ncbi:hypothetical protein BDFB_014634, partial [Asbolus verrucosus]
MVVMVRKEIKDTKDIITTKRAKKVIMIKKHIKENTKMRVDPVKSIMKNLGIMENILKEKKVKKELSIMKMENTAKVIVPKVHIVFTRKMNMKRNKNFMMNITKAANMKNMEVFMMIINMKKVDMRKVVIRKVDIMKIILVKRDI